MHHRLKSFERRLTRIAGRLRGLAEEAAEAAELHDARQAVAGLIRFGLERAGLDPAEALSLRRLEQPAPPPVPPPRRRPLDPRRQFFAEMRTLAERLRGHPPALATASPIALLAYYCFGDGAREAPA